jgi:Ras-related protein Rab-1A
MLKLTVKKMKFYYKIISIGIVDISCFSLSMSSNSYDYLIKCLVVGDSGTGKSSLMLRFTDDVFNTSYISTIGVDFKIKTMEIRDKTVKFQIWDTAGQDRFRTITSSYYRGSNAVILCYDTTDKNTFKNIVKWLDEVKMYSAISPLLILCGTKIDLEKEREVDRQEAEDFAKANNMHFFESSAKNNSNINEIFELIGENKIIAISNGLTDTYDKNDLRKAKINLRPENETGKNNSCC